MKRKSSKGNILIILGLLLIVAAFSLAGYNVWDARRAENASADIVGKLEDRIGGRNGAAKPLINDGEDNPFIPAMPTEEIDGYRYIGELTIPSLDLKLPVMEEWDYERLKISACRYTGSYYTDDLVICAHNYARHFSPIKWIDIGADIFFKNVEGVVYHYSVSNRETLQPVQVSALIENDSNSAEKGVTADWDLSLFTCNTGGQTRCVVRCDRVDEK